MFDSFATLWTVARQAPLSTGFSRQEYWSGLPGPPPGDLPYPSMEPVSLMSPALAGGFFTTGPPGKPVASSVTHKISLYFIFSISKVYYCLKTLLSRDRVNIYSSPIKILCKISTYLNKTMNNKQAK